MNDTSLPTGSDARELRKDLKSEWYELQSALADLALLPPDEIDRLHVRAASSVLYDFCRGVRNMLRLSLTAFGEPAPSEDIPLVAAAARASSRRPAIVDSSLQSKLDRYYRWRHDPNEARLNWTQIAPLLIELPALSEDLTMAFEQFDILLAGLESG